MAIELLPVPPLRNLSASQDVRRLMDHLNAIQVQVGRLSDNADLPATPSAIVVRQGAGKVVEIVVTFAEPPFPWLAELWRSTTNDVTVATKIATETSHTFHDTNVSYASTYYYFARTVGLGGANFSGYSPSSGHSITVSQVVTGDITALNITAAELAALAVTTGKINDNAVTVRGQYSNDASFALTTSFQEIGTLTISTDGGDVVVLGKCGVSPTALVLATGRPSISVKLTKDSITGTLLDTQATEFSDDTTDLLHVSVVLIGLDSSPASTQTYKLAARYDNTNTGGEASLRRIVHFNLKK